MSPRQRGGGNYWAGLSPADVTRLRGLRRQGMSAAEIARRMDLSVRTIWRYLAPDRYSCRHCKATFPTSLEALTHAIETAS